MKLAYAAIAVAALLYFAPKNSQGAQVNPASGKDVTRNPPSPDVGMNPALGPIYINDPRMRDVPIAVLPANSPNQPPINAPDARPNRQPARMPWEPDASLTYFGPWSQVNPLPPVMPVAAPTVTRPPQDPANRFGRPTGFGPVMRGDPGFDVVLQGDGIHAPGYGPVQPGDSGSDSNPTSTPAFTPTGVPISPGRPHDSFGDPTNATM